MVGEEHRLRPLQVGVAGHDHVQVRLGLLYQRPLQVPHRGDQPAQGLLHVEVHVRGHLVVAAAAGVELARQRPHHPAEQMLHVHVHVFQRRVEGELAPLQAAAHLFQALHQGPSLFGR